jgi:hypothetical protein
MQRVSAGATGRPDQLRVRVKGHKTTIATAWWLLRSGMAAAAAAAAGRVSAAADQGTPRNRSDVHARPQGAASCRPESLKITCLK